MNKPTVILVVGFALSAGVCFAFGRAVPFAVQWPLYEGMRTTAAIVFGVIGLWLSILYPRALQAVFRTGKAVHDGDHQNVQMMIQNIRLSTLILIVVMAVGLMSPMLKQLTSLALYFEYFRASGFALLGGLTFVQFWSLILLLAHAQIAEDDLHVSAKFRGFIDAYRSRHKK